MIITQRMELRITGGRLVRDDIRENPKLSKSWRPGAVTSTLGLPHNAHRPMAGEPLTIRLPGSLAERRTLSECRTARPELAGHFPDARFLACPKLALEDPTEHVDRKKKDG